MKGYRRTYNVSLIGRSKIEGTLNQLKLSLQRLQRRSMKGHNGTYNVSLIGRSMKQMDGLELTSYQGGSSGYHPL